MRNFSHALATALICAFLGFADPVRALECKQTVTELWIAAHQGGDPMSLFKKDGQPIKAVDIGVDDKLISNEEIWVRPNPRNFEAFLFLLARNKTIIVRDLRQLPSDFGNQVWIRVDLLDLQLSLTNEQKGRVLEWRETHYDDDGLIVQWDPTLPGNCDGGDTAQREGWYWLGVWIRQHATGMESWKPKRKLDFDQVLDLLEPGLDGIFYRHPKLPPWNNPTDTKFGFDRDQLVPLVAAMGVWGKYERIVRLWNALPEDRIGKKAFNGRWLNPLYLFQDGPNCTDIKNYDCQNFCPLKPPIVCPPPKPVICPPVKKDLCPPFIDCNAPLLNLDPLCSVKSKPNNDLSNACVAKNKEIEDVACEPLKQAVLISNSTEDWLCALRKETKNATDRLVTPLCELAKTPENIAPGKPNPGKLACEGARKLAYDTCRLGSYYDGDLISPATINLFLRALDEDPLAPNWKDLKPPAIFRGGVDGEMELLANQFVLGRSATKPAYPLLTLLAWRLLGTPPLLPKIEDDKDNVGDDLNNIVLLLMTALKHPSPISEDAIKAYLKHRPQNYGSYLDAYYKAFGDDLTDIKSRLDGGIAAGWPTDLSAQYGAVRWYHRPEPDRNPQLAKLYSIIIERLLK